MKCQDCNRETWHQPSCVRVADAPPGQAAVGILVGSEFEAQTEPDLVNSPPHYRCVPGVECIEVTRHLGFADGSAVKYLWRCDAKGRAFEDLEKAIFYLTDPRLAEDYDPTPKGRRELAHKAFDRAQGYFPYNIGTAINFIIDGDAELAADYVRDEIERRKA